MSIIAVVAVGMFVPSWKPIHVDALCAQTDTHVTVATFGDYLHLKVVDSTSYRYGVSCSD